jgi:hypothetical protein
MSVSSAGVSAPSDDEPDGASTSATQSASASATRSATASELSARLSALRTDAALHALVRHHHGRVPVARLAEHLSWPVATTRIAAQSLALNGTSTSSTCRVLLDTGDGDGDDNNVVVVVVVTPRCRVVLRGVPAGASRAGVVALLHAARVPLSHHSLERISRPLLSSNSVATSLSTSTSSSSSSSRSSTSSQTTSSSSSSSMSDAFVDWVVAFASESDALLAIDRLSSPHLALLGAPIRPVLRSETPAWLLPPLHLELAAAARAASLASMQQFFYNSNLPDAKPRANRAAAPHQASRSRAPRRSARKNASCAVVFNIPPAATSAAAAATTSPSISSSSSSSSSSAISDAAFPPLAPLARPATTTTTTTSTANATVQPPRHRHTPSHSEPSSSGRGSERSRSSSATSSNGEHNGLLLSDPSSPPSGALLSAATPVVAAAAASAPLAPTTTTLTSSTATVDILASPKRSNVTFAVPSRELVAGGESERAAMRQSVPPPMSKASESSGLVKAYSTGHASASRPWHEYDDDDDDGMEMLARDFLTSSLTLLKPNNDDRPVATPAATVKQAPVSWAAMAAAMSSK